jgi:hypothetical protein
MIMFKKLFKMMTFVTYSYIFYDKLNFTTILINIRKFVNFTTTETIYSFIKLTTKNNFFKIMSNNNSKSKCKPNIMLRFNRLNSK